MIKVFHALRLMVFLMLVGLTMHQWWNAPQMLNLPLCAAFIVFGDNACDALIKLL